MIDIVIPTINLKYTDICLKSLRKRTKRRDYRLILVADQATPADHQYLDSVDADVKVFNDGFQAGVSRVWNQGLKHMKNDYILIANNDILFHDDWCSKLESYATQHPEIGCLSAWSHWIGEVPLTVEGEDNCNSQLLQYSDSHQEVTQPGMQGCFFMLKKEVVEKVGEFDEVNFIKFCWEDCDFLVRMRKAGFKDVIWHGAPLYHWGARTTTSKEHNGNVDSWTTSMANRVRYYQKWGISDQLNKQWSVNSSMLYIENREVQYPA